MRGKTIASESSARFGICVCGAADPSDEDWAEYLAEIVPHASKGSEYRFLVWTDGGNLTIGQRKKLSELLANATATAVILTESRLVRGTLTALGWVMKMRMTAFGHRDLDAALEKLGLDRQSWAHYRKTIEELRGSLR